MNCYAAKFAREAKPRPSDWLIVPTRAGQFRLVYIGTPSAAATRYRLARDGEI